MAWFEEVRAGLMARATRRPGVRVAVAEACGRVLAEAVGLPRLPSCAVAGIDGLAVIAAGTEGASDYAPVPVAGSPVAAGCPLPHGLDAVLPPWAFDDGPVALATVAPGSFVVPAGHDAAEGAVLAAGTVLRPLHLVLLGQAGFRDVVVVDRPGVSLEAAEGDGLLPMLTALVQAEGALVTAVGDLMLRIGEDRAVWSGGPPEFRVRGEGDVPEITLPADPVRCFLLFTLLVAPVLRGMGGFSPRVGIGAKLERKVSSSLGQVDAVPVRLSDGMATPLGPAEGCGLLAAAGADGLLLVPWNSEGYAEAATVEVIALA